MSISEDMMRDHWWWRPGWSLGRSFYTWHITFSDQPQVANLISHYSRAIKRFPTLDTVTLDGMHLTIQGIGFTDEIDQSTVDQIVAATDNHCSQLDSFQIEIGPAHADSETVQMPVRPVDPIVNLRSALRRGIGDIWGQENVPESMAGFQPHVTLAYSNGVATIRSIELALLNSKPIATEVTVSHISLIELNRDRKRYEWSETAVINLAR